MESVVEGAFSEFSDAFLTSEEVRENKKNNISHASLSLGSDKSKRETLWDETQEHKEKQNLTVLNMKLKESNSARLQRRRIKRSHGRQMIFGGLFEDDDEDVVEISAEREPGTYFRSLLLKN